MITYVDDETKRRIERLEIPFNREGIDPYGVSKRHLGPILSMLRLFYTRYFRMDVRGVEHVPARGRVMLVGNHSGGIALDATMTMTALFYELEPPRLAQAMADKFIPTLPFVGTLTSRMGQFTGLPEHAVRLLEDERLLMVFPEGARGTAKLFHERHSLVDFGTGFMRLALHTKTPIVPFAFVGGGDAIPTIFNSYTLGKLVGAPYVPFTPWIAAVPAPARLSLELGEPMRFDGTGNEEDDAIAERVDRVRHRVAELIESTLARRSEVG